MQLVPLLKDAARLQSALGQFIKLAAVEISGAGEPDTGELDGDLIAHHARVFPRLGNALKNRIRVVLPEGQKLKHRVRVGVLVQAPEARLFSGHHQQRIPAQAVELIRLLQQHVVVHIQNARRILGPLHVPGQPEQRVCDAR